MADKKITQLTALTGANAVAGDQLAIVDVSDTTMSASGTTKKIALSELQAAPLSAGTANGVAYLNGSKVLTTGSALTFDGTNLGVGTASPSYGVDVCGASGVGIQIFETSTGNNNRLILTQQATVSTYHSTFSTGSGAHAWQLGNSEQMRLTSTGLGIGTSSPSAKLSIGGSNAPKLNLLVANGSERVFIDYTEATTVMRIDCDGDIAFRPNNTEVVRMSAFGSVGIGTSSPSASAILDVQSTTKGVRMPNMTTTQKNAIASPAAGLMVFDTTLAKLCVYTGAAWQTITSA